MTIKIRKGTADVAASLVAQYNQLRKTVAVANSKFHADVTSLQTTGDFSALTAASKTITSANASDTATGVTLANEIKAWCAVHFADTFAHKVADASVAATLAAVANASDDATTVTLATAIKTAILAHLPSTTVHYSADSGTDGTSITNAATARTSLNAVKALINAHVVSAPTGNSLELIEA